MLIISSVRGFEIIILFSRVRGLPADPAQSDHLRLLRKEEHIRVINILIQRFEQVQLPVKIVLKGVKLL